MAEASSRIFIKGLPPTFTEEDFRKHFGQKWAITDAKIFPQRRIGYVGYKTPEDAQKAVKWFNRSFIRMSKIGVELARPVKEERSKAAEAQKFYEAKQNAIAKFNPLKRKLPSPPPEKKDDPKLQEFLAVSLPSKKKAWANDGLDGVDVDTAAPTEDTHVHAVEEKEAESEDEYQSVPKKRRQEHSHPVAESKSILGDKDTAVEQGDSETKAGTQITESGPISDADWLRSRTNRVLDLVEDGEHATGAAKAESSASPVADYHLEGAVENERQGNSKPETEDKEVEEAVDKDVATIGSNGRLFVRNLAYTATEQDLRAYFGSMGELQEVHIPIDRGSGQSKGFAYLQFADPEDALRAFQSLDGVPFQGRLLHVLPSLPKRENKLDEFAISKMSFKKQREFQRKSEAKASNFNWNALYMNADAVISSVSDRLGVSKSELLDPTSSDAAVKQAQAETHIIQETKAYFSKHGVDLDAFKRHERGDTTILVKNFAYGTKIEELRTLFEEHGQVLRCLMPPAGTIAIIEFAQALQSRSAFASLAFRRFKDTPLFLEKAPKDVFKAGAKADAAVPDKLDLNGNAPKLSAIDLLARDTPTEVVDTTTLFVRNLNFSTTSERLAETFKPLDGFISGRVKTKTDPKKPGQLLSMGFGFLEFQTKDQAQAALVAMDGYNLDSHKLLIKASHKGLDAAEERHKEDRAKKAAGRRTKIIIKNLPFEVSKKDVRSLFGQYGQLRSVRVPKKFDHSTRGFAFADFTTPREAENAIDALRHTHLLGRKLVLEFAAEEPEDAEAEIEKMQQKVGSQVNKVALQKLTSGGRKKFNVAGNDDLDEPS